MLHVLETPSAHERPDDTPQLVWDEQRYVSGEDGTTVGAPPGLEQYLFDELLAQQLQQEEHMGDLGRSGEDSWRLLTEQMLRLQFDNFDSPDPLMEADSPRLSPLPRDSMDFIEDMLDGRRRESPPDAPESDGVFIQEESSDTPTSSPSSVFVCGICEEEHNSDLLVFMKECNHSFCRTCLRRQVGYKLASGRYPIFCPTCEASFSRNGYTKLSDEHFKALDLPPEELTKIERFQLLPHAITIQCPRCSESMQVAREQFIEEKVLVCPLQRCGHKWCKDCQKTLPSSERRHHCKARNINYLMRFKGWKRCPGCLTPIQKESGCNHITCSAPGCNVHFCYRCGEFIVDTSASGGVGVSVNEHYAKCRQFDREWLGGRCNIM